jgi:hypothetical protein
VQIQSYIFHTAVFKKQFFSIHNLAHLCFEKGRQIIKEHNCFPQKLGAVSAQFYVSRFRSVKGATTKAAWFFILYFLTL